MNPLLLTVFLEFLLLCFQQVDADCSVGNQNIPESNPINTPGLYVNRDDQILCTGQLTTWNYCYYEPFNDRRITYTFQFSVWRFNSQNNVYIKVGMTEESVRLRQRRDNFICSITELRRRDYIDVQIGDYLGVTLNTPTLPVAATVTGSRLLYYNGAVTASQLQEVAVGNLNLLSEIALHLSADIVGDELQVETTTTAAAETIATTILTTSTSLAATLPPESTTSDQEINPTRSSVREPDNQIATDTRTTTPAIQSAALNFDTDTIGGIAGGLVVLVCAALAVLLSVVLCRRRRARYSTKERSAGKEMAEPHGADTAVRAKLGIPGDYEETYPTKDEKPHVAPEAEGADEAVYECIPGKDSDGRKENIYECPSDAKGMSNMSQEDIYECI